MKLFNRIAAWSLFWAMETVEKRSALSNERTKDLQRDLSMAILNHADEAAAAVRAALALEQDHYKDLIERWSDLKVSHNKAVEGK